jgi:hypothetical protein
MRSRQIVGIIPCAVFALASGCGQKSDSNSESSPGSGGVQSASGGTAGPTGGTLGTIGGVTNTAGASVSGGASGGTAASGGRAGPGAGGAAGGSNAGGESGGVGGTSAGGAKTGPGGSPPQGGAGGNDVIVTIKNGDFWLDTAGKRIEAHGGGLIHTNDAWYWVGEDKSGTSNSFVNCYRSTDLSHWEFRHAIVTRQTASELGASDRIIERPKVVYNDTTKKYVVWLHWEGQNYATAEAGVFTSDTVDGDYTLVRHFRPNSNMSRDDTLFKDDDGKAYFLSASNENADLSLYALTDDYTNLKSQLATLWPGSYREAPAIMKADGRYFIVNSAATNWDPNQQKYATATSMTSAFGSLSNVGNGTGYDTQTAFVIPFVGSKTTTYIYAGDRWQDPDLKSSKYIWLPIKVTAGKLAMDYYDSWQLNVTTGEWSAGGTDDGFLPRTGWSLVSVDSEETSGEDGHATNAFDDSTSTFWHTQWQGTQPPPPHELVIDLGARYSLTTVRYTPRQDGNPNGMVGNYEFYVSDSTSDWGAAVKTGTFTNATQPTTATFAAKAGRYIRFRAMSELTGKAYTCVAEIDVSGTLI